jgi:hypothetical protein
MIADDNCEVMNAPKNINLISPKIRSSLQVRWFSMQYLVVFIILTIAISVSIPIFWIPVVNHGNWFILIVIVPWMLYVIYWLLTKIINRSVLTISNNNISITHGPLPQKRNTDFNILSLRDFRLETKRYSGRSRRIYYEITALDRKKERITIISDIDDYGQGSQILEWLNNKEIKRTNYKTFID